MKSIIGKNIARLRAEKRMSKSDLAKETGLSRASISKYEKGTRNPKIEAIQKIADALGVTPATLYAHKDDPLPQEEIGAVFEEPSAYTVRDVYDQAAAYLRNEASENCKSAVEIALRMDGKNINLTPKKAN